MREVVQKWFLVVALCAPFMMASSNGLAEEKQASTPAVARPESQTSAGKATIQFAETTLNFGEAIEGTEVSHTFVLKNTGSEELRIEQVRPG
ncbi:MAG: DUF1573 domain-containing protein [Syntrophobacteraceae bacterium]|jgi:hypothetical protein|nr:DUF1573 domain-containing protein [Syntrophobacteraceae bacterium]